MLGAGKVHQTQHLPSRFAWLLLGALAWWASASACSCDEEGSPTPDIQTPDADTGNPDASDVPTDVDPDADVSPDVDPDADDAKEDPDAEEDADTDVDDADVEDMDAGDGDTGTPDVVQPDADVPLADSCLLEAIGCLGANVETLSCSVNPALGETAVSYGDGAQGNLAARWRRNDDGVIVFEAFVGGELCYEGVAGDASLSPLTWSFAAQGGTYSLEIVGDEARIRCADGTREAQPRADVEAYLPQLLASDDPLCDSLANARCTQDAECEQFDDTLECCEVVGLSRCLTGSQCPDVPEPPPIDSCVGPLLGCFGRNRVPLECTIDPNVGQTQTDYLGGYRSIVTEDGFGNVQIETASADALCYTARVQGRGPWEEIVFVDPNTGDEHVVTLDGDEAQVRCADGTQEEQESAAILANLPTLLDADDGVCEVLPVNACDPGQEDSCAEGLCCETLTGARCLLVEGCPVARGLSDSCAFDALQCFGRNNIFQICGTYEAIGQTEVSYTSGARALFFTDGGQGARRVWRGDELCFDAVALGGGAQGYELTDAQGEDYRLEVVGEQLRVTCADGTVEPLYPASEVARLRAYFPAAPSAAACLDAENNLCPRDGCGLGEVCCNLGDRSACIAEDQCERNEPRETCAQTSECPVGQECCELETVRVCDPRVCPQGQVCCDIAPTTACGSARLCATRDECDPNDQSSCEGGSVCCPTELGTRCLEGEVCPNGDPWANTCLFETFECFDADAQLTSCEYNPGIDQTSASYAGGFGVTFFETLGREALRVRNGVGLECFTAVEAGGGVEVADGVTGERYFIRFGPSLAQISCPDGQTQQAPRQQVEAYLPLEPSQGVCSVANNDECSQDDECQELDESFVCCNTGERRRCVPSQTCDDLQVFTRCDGNDDCPGFELCCEQQNVVVCDPTVCGDQACCLQPQAQVCASETVCAAQDLCDPLDLDTCPGGTLCCDSPSGTRCLNAGVCPDGTVENSCIGALLECFGDEYTLQSCGSYDQGGVIVADYGDGREATFYDNLGRPTVRTQNSALSCFEAAQRAGGYDVQDLVLGRSYGVQFDGDRAQVTCPGGFVEELDADAILAYIPLEPAANACPATYLSQECTNDAACTGGEVCCDTGDRTVCTTEEACGLLRPRTLCEDDVQCGQGTQCCSRPISRVCNPSVCPPGQACCEVAGLATCGTEEECEAPADACDLQDAQSCPTPGTRCCDTHDGTRCLEGNTCPDLWADNCLRPVLDCQGDGLTQTQCFLDGPTGVESRYDNGARIEFSNDGLGRQTRQSYSGNDSCFSAVLDGQTWEITDLVGGGVYRAEEVGGRFEVACADGTTQRAPVETVRGYFPPPPVREQCLDPAVSWQQSCLFPVFQCAGPNYALDACVDYGQIDRTEAEYVANQRVVFSESAGRDLARVSFGRLPCFDVLGLAQGEGYDVTDMADQGMYHVEIRDGVAEITCPDDSVDVVDAGFLAPYVPTRPDARDCQRFPRNDACTSDRQCTAQGEICCDVGLSNTCINREGCFNNEAQTLCGDDAQCGQGQFCCERQDVRVCDVALCGDQICCVVPQAQVCGDEAECNGIFNECQNVNQRSVCQQGALCCETGEGNRCIEGALCPEPPNPLAGSCLFDTLECFGRRQEVDACVDYGDEAQLVEVVYASGAQASFYQHEGDEALRTLNAPLRCFDAFTTTDGYAILDLRVNQGYQVRFDGPQAVIECANGSTETVPRSAVEAYFPERPVVGCDAPTVQDQCATNAQCGNGQECCDTGLGKLCVAPGTCERNTPHVSCDEAVDCGQGEECCGVGGVRVCNPLLCPQGQPCCNLLQGQVCGTSAECHEYEDVCAVNNPATCPVGSQCCPTNDGTRCVSGGGACPPVQDPWPTSCLYDLFECGGDDGLQIAQCVDFGGETFRATYQNGSTHTFRSYDGARGREVRRDEEACYRAVEVSTGDGGYDVVDLDTLEPYRVRFEGSNARIECPDQTVVNVPAGTVRRYLPPEPVGQQCLDPGAAWRSSCLYGVFQCAGGDKTFASCESYVDQQADFLRVEYVGGGREVFYFDGGREARRTWSANQACFRAEGLLDQGMEVEDLVTRQGYRLEVAGDTVDITCPDGSVETVRASDVRAYLPSRPNRGLCEILQQDQRCTTDGQCLRGEVCCDLGESVECLPRLTCEQSRPRPTCDEDAQCAQGETCCERGPMVVCDPDLCGEEVCCSVASAQVCGTEDECNGVFDACTVGVASSCANGEACCDTVDGNRCVIGECPPPPDPLDGTCIIDTFQCFSRSEVQDSCVDWGDLGYTEVSYESGRRAVFYEHQGSPSTYVGDAEFFCYEAQRSAGGVKVRDVRSGESFQVDWLNDQEARLTCPDRSTATVSRAAVEAYLPTPPDPATCEGGEPVVACADDAECGEGSVCCDVGDRVECLPSASCDRYQVRQTCNNDDQCGLGESCCALVATRVCDPAVCGDELCCNRDNLSVCGTSAECNEVLDVCNAQSNTGCNGNERCCDTLSGTRCVAGVNQCPPIRDPWAQSCLFATMECFGADQQVASCVASDGGLGDIDATFASGARARYGSQLGLASISTSNGQRGCFDAVALDNGGGGYTITDARTRQAYPVTFVGDVAQVECPDQTVVNVPRTTVEAYLPPPPPALSCASDAQVWQTSCLYGTLTCFGPDHQIPPCVEGFECPISPEERCVEYGELGIKVVTYPDDSVGQFFARGDRDVLRASAGGFGCFEYAESGVPGEYEVRDLRSGESFGLTYDGGAVQILCPNQVVQVVDRDLVEPYLPAAPDACVAPPDANDQCGVDEDCDDPALVCCDVGDQKQCRSRAECARLQVRTTCDDDLQCASEGGLCCELAPVRVCDPALCNGALCCDLARGSACADARTCGGVVDVCDLEDATTCGEAQTCCPSLTGTVCVEGLVCPQLPNTIEQTCMRDVLECFGQRDFNVCLAWEDAGVIESSHTFSGEAIHFTRDGQDAVETFVGQLPCYVAQDQGEDGFVLTDLRGRTPTQYQVFYDGADVLVSCPNGDLQAALRSDLELYVPVRPDEADCVVPNREEACQVNADCGQGTVCCEMGDRTACLTAEDCYEATPRAACSDDANCGEGEACCAIANQRVCDPLVCGAEEICCDVPVGQSLDVCGTFAACAGIYDACDVQVQGACGQGSLCCPTEEGTRCLVGDVCPEPPDPVAATCLFEAVECFGRDQAPASCSLWEDIDRQEVRYAPSGSVAVFGTTLGDPVATTSLGGAACMEVVTTDAGYTIRDLGNGRVHRVVVEGGQADIQCASGQRQSVSLAALLRWLPAQPPKVLVAPGGNTDDPPVAEGCAPGVRLDDCEDDEQCAALDEALVCCDVGDGASCLTRDGCARQQPLVTCDSGADCGMGETCCALATARVCDPALCGEQVCCDVANRQVCATQDRCNGVVDECDVQDPGSCAQGDTCCETVGGARCLTTDTCPGDFDLVRATCLGDILGCIDPEPVLSSCDDYTPLDYTDADYGDGQRVIYFEREQRPVRRAIRNTATCYDALERTDGSLEITSYLGLGGVFGVTFAGGEARIDCPGNLADAVVPESALRAYLPARPDAGQCADARDEDCDQDRDCAQGEVCCDLGNASACLPSGECAGAQPVAPCDLGQDTQCGQGEACCNLTDVRVCDPAICGNNNTCCTVGQRAVCAAEQVCEGIVDECELGNAQACVQGSLCCDTAEGTRCVLGDTCPPAPDPLAGTCLEAPLACLGRYPELSSCVDWGGRPDRTEMRTDAGTDATFFDHPSGFGLLAERDGNDCYLATALEGADGLVIADRRPNNARTHTVRFEGQMAEVACADGSTFTVERSAVEDYLPTRPSAQLCQAAPRNDNCAADNQCGQGQVCCDLGDRRSCAFPETCFAEELRDPCLSDEGCAQGEVCCLKAPARTCDPTRCADDQTCCTVASASVCTTGAECDGVADLCSLSNPASCLGGSVCCATDLGNRCFGGTACPADEDEVLASCLGPMLGCFGPASTLTRTTCGRHPTLGIYEAAYSNNSEAQFFTDAQDRAAIRTSSGPLSCYVAHQTQGGWALDDLLALTGTANIIYDGATARVTCADGQTQNLPRAQVERYLPTRPADAQCPVAERNDECDNNAECTGLNVSLRCCDVGDRDVCGGGDTCVLSQPRDLCNDDAQCPNGEVCCALGSARVCDPEVCDGELCCDVQNAPVCATADECDGIFDFCSLTDASTCQGNERCCDTAEGNRCVTGNTCPIPEDPLVASCLGATLQCFGDANTFTACQDYGTAEVISATYRNEDGTTHGAQFYTREGLDARRTTNGGQSCFNAIDLADGGHLIEDLRSGQSYRVSLQLTNAVISCPDGTTDRVPLASLRAYLPDAPATNACTPAVVNNQCTNDAQCQGQDPDLICCDTGEGRTCATSAQCAATLAPAPTCSDDAQCGDGVGCCAREMARVCDPGLCDGQVCCLVPGVQTCGGTPGACAVSQTCLADALACPGDFGDLAACTNHQSLDLVAARYEGGAAAIFYSDALLDTDAVRTSSNGVGCYDAVQTADGYEVFDVRGAQSVSVLVQGQDAQITCGDGTQQVIPLAALTEALPDLPNLNQCAAPVPQNACARDSDCTAITGAGSTCCPNGLGNSCVAAGSTCAVVAPAQQCASGDDCAPGVGCCNPGPRRVCDPGICGEAICCDLPQSASVCDAACPQCDTSDDCADGMICCPFGGGTCTTVAECVAPDECSDDAQCGDGEVCCRASGRAVCTASDLCSEACDTNTDCRQGEVCCGSQSSPFGTYCTPENLCEDPPQPACQTSADCGQGNACCHTLPEVACVPVAQCPAACDTDADCGQGRECCGSATRTPVCVAAGSCKADLGEACAQSSECETGLTCCPYDVLGPVCVPAASCDQAIPPTPCGADPGLCDAYPLAVCCAVNGAPVCASRYECDKAQDLCADDTDCGSGSACCDGQLDPVCVPWYEPACQ